MLTELLPERLEDYVRSPLSLFDMIGWGVPMRIEAFGDPVAAPALREALQRVVRLLDQSSLADADREVLARARLDRKAMTREEIERIQAVFTPRVGMLLERIAARRHAGEDGREQHADAKADDAGQASQALLNNLVMFEDDVVYTLGRLGATGALTGVAAARPFLLVWAVHLLMAQVYEQYTGSDLRAELSPALGADLRKRLLSTFGLGAEEREEALALYMLTASTGVRMRYSRRSAGLRGPWQGSTEGR